jgi:hypothetical protein
MDRDSRVRRDLTVFQVGRFPLAPGTLLRPYYMGKHVDRISEIQAVLASRPTELLRYFSATTWPSAEQLDPELGFSSDILKMMAVLEAIFEEARKRLAPEMPSRLASIFAWPTLAVAERFKAEYLPTGTIHQCRVVEGAVIERDGGLLPPGIDLQSKSALAFQKELDATRLRAEAYWRGHRPQDFPELLIIGTVITIAAC